MMVIGRDFQTYSPCFIEVNTEFLGTAGQGFDENKLGVINEFIKNSYLLTCIEENYKPHSLLLLTLSLQEKTLLGFLT
jgi:hypothetical protein